MFFNGLPRDEYTLFHSVCKDGHAPTVQQYLAELPADRREAIQAVREVILRNLDKDFEEGMTYGMIGYYVPHRVYPAGYHCDSRQPLPFASLASQKNHMAVYLMCIYGGSEEEQRFRAAWAKTGKKLDMGKCCLRFKRLDDLALDVIGEAIRCVPAKMCIERYEAVLRRTPKKTGATSKTRPPKKTSRFTAPAKSRKSSKPVRSARKKA